jgi:ParB family chromosome partitioning protein
MVGNHNEYVILIWYLGIIIGKVVMFKMAHVKYNSGNDDWYTPIDIINAVKNVLGEIDLDPASSKIANKNINAKVYYTIDEDGLNKEWDGRVFLNPPYSRPLCSKFLEKLINSPKITEAILLINNNTETIMTQKIFSKMSLICLPKHRIKFLDTNGNPKGSPLQGQLLAYCGKNRQKFIDEFKQFGVIMELVN